MTRPFSTVNLSQNCISFGSNKLKQFPTFTEARVPGNQPEPARQTGGQKKTERRSVHKLIAAYLTSHTSRLAVSLS